MSKLIATFFYVGLMPKAPGTWGSLAALPFAIIIFAMGSFPALLIATIATFFIGWWATAQHTANTDNHDPGEVVIDEVVGQWITLFPLAGMLWLWEVPLAILPWPGLVVGLMFFRFFDILKPWPVSWADKKETPFGVMLDDVFAGIMAATLTTLLGALAHGYI
ncbi:phosphatidylglycerophosphatase A [Amylibacter sp. SFDW26]|uniref:phosphatidylglycerophosphatase A family protein n=1 Tax=Amylibacter sp. SFDW26 TaxID=2652722 RepID=UPI001262464E|nr:phosphatidylglycerophosphatase A [Amylibacter sp. SFDW26]KAB7615743.1 phosphatidylglycerophosphatase A [Amylibacter sp. SFDW26]